MTIGELIPKAESWEALFGALAALLLGVLATWWTNQRRTQQNVQPESDNEFDPEAAKQIEFGDRALSDVVNAMPMIRFDIDNLAHVYAVSLHASIVQLCGGCLALAKTEHSAGVPILLRSLYEAVVDLDNLVRDPDYRERMEAANLVQFLKVLEASPSNPLLAGLAERHDLVALKTELSSQLEDLHSRRRGQMDFRARCEAVSRGNEYKSIYLLLCLDAHNNVTSLFDRHLSGRESGQVEVSVFGDGNPVGLATRVSMGVGWMLQSAEFVHGAFHTGYAGIAQLQKQHTDLRKAR